MGGWSCGCSSELWRHSQEVVILWKRRARLSWHVLALVSLVTAATRTSAPTPPEPTPSQAHALMPLCSRARLNELSAAILEGVPLSSNAVEEGAGGCASILLTEREVEEHPALATLIGGAAVDGPRVDQVGITLRKRAEWGRGVKVELVGHAPATATSHSNQPQLWHTGRSVQERSARHRRQAQR